MNVPSKTLEPQKRQLSRDESREESPKQPKQSESLDEEQEEKESEATGSDSILPKSDFSGMPPEMWEEVLSFVNFPDFVSVQRTCKGFHSLVLGSGRWRETLFLMEGECQFHGMSKGDPESVSFDWTGNELCAYDCHDARSVGMPSLWALSDSDRTFESNGMANCVNESNIPVACATTYSFQQRIVDENSTENMIFLRRENLTDFFIVVACGQDKFGSYVSAGRNKVCGNPSGPMVLGRRYLQESDPRVLWTVAHLLEAIMVNASDHVPIWQSMALHANPEEEATAVVPRIRMPTQDGKPFRLLLNFYNGFVRPNTSWMSQCWGCGGPEVDDRWSFVMTEVNEVFYDIMEAEFCCADCILKAIPELARGSRELMSQRRSNGAFRVSSNDQAFWEVVAGNSDALASMMSSGWRNKDAEDLHEVEWSCERMYVA